jgi:hypothetical protein
VPVSAAVDEELAWELHGARELLRRLHELGVIAAVVGLIDGTPLVICQNEKDVAALCNRILSAYAIPGERTLQ